MAWFGPYAHVLLGPTLGGLDGCRFRLELHGASDSEWRIHDPGARGDGRHPWRFQAGGHRDSRQLEVIPDPYGHLLAFERTMTVKANSAGWVVSKSVRDRDGVIDAVEILDFTQGSTGAPPIDATPDTFDDREAHPSSRVGS